MVHLITRTHWSLHQIKRHEYTATDSRPSEQHSEYMVIDRTEVFVHILKWLSDAEGDWVPIEYRIPEDLSIIPRNVDDISDLVDAATTFHHRIQELESDT